MADNKQPSANPTLRTDEIGALDIPGVKIVLGAADQDDGFVDAGQQAAAASVPAVLASDQLPLRSKFLVFSSSTSSPSNSAGNNVVLAARASLKFRVYAIWLQAEGTVTVKFTEGSATERSGGTTAPTGSGPPRFVLQAREAVYLAAPLPAYLFETQTANTALNINLSAAVAVDWWILYEEF